VFCSFCQYSFQYRARGVLKEVDPVNSKNKYVHTEWEMSQASLQILFAHTVPGSSQYLVNCATPAGKLLKVQPVQQESDFVMSLCWQLLRECL